MRLLRYHGVEPLLVFDGDRLPAKAAEEASRQAKRAERRSAGHAALERGDQRAAEQAFQAAVDVTPLMAREVMDGLMAENFRYLVAPYEADSQLAHLARSGQVDVVATEDSDLVAFGCPRVLFKLSKDGEGVEVRLSQMLGADGPPSTVAAEAGPAADAGDASDEAEEVVATSRRRPRAASGPLSFRRFDQDLFLCMCILAGCDYLPSIRGVGLRRAHALALRARSPARLLALLRTEPLGQPRMAEAERGRYITGFSRALQTFRHARVYCPAERRLVLLAPLPDGAEEEAMLFLGPPMADAEAAAIAEGRLCPLTRAPFPPRGGGAGRPPPQRPPPAPPPAPCAGSLDRAWARDGAPQLPRPPPPPRSQPRPRAMDTSRLPALHAVPPPTFASAASLAGDELVIIDADDAVAPLPPPPPPFPPAMRPHNPFASSAPRAPLMTAALPRPPAAKPPAPLALMWGAALAEGRAWQADTPSEAAAWAPPPALTPAPPKKRAPGRTLDTFLTPPAGVPRRAVASADGKPTMLPRL